MIQFVQDLASPTGRLRDATVADRESPRTPTGPTLQAGPLTDHFKTWRQIRFREPLPLLLVPILAAAFYLLAAVVHVVPLNLGWPAIHAVVLGGLGIYVILLSFDWLRFRKWRKRLPFQLLGWNGLVNSTAFSVGAWRHGHIKLHLHSRTPPEVVKLFASTLVVFAHRANSSYGQRYENDPRRYWETDYLETNGSLNVNVAALIEKLCRQKLAELHERFPHYLQRVELYVQDSIFVIEQQEEAA
jgi:hypothetical protein